MALEIERRFLVEATALPDLAELSSEQIRQGYLTKPDDSLVVRVRAVQDFDAGRAANQGVITERFSKLRAFRPESADTVNTSCI